MLMLLLLRGCGVCWRHSAHRALSSGRRTASAGAGVPRFDPFAHDLSERILPHIPKPAFAFAYGSAAFKQANHVYNKVSKRLASSSLPLFFLFPTLSHWV